MTINELSHTTISDDFDEFANRVNFDILMYKLLSLIDKSHLRLSSTLKEMYDSKDELYEIYKRYWH